MNALALAERRPAAGVTPPPPDALLVQRRSTLADAGPVAAPALRDAGRPLDAGVRGEMEAGFGRSFADVRVHDDAHAHDSARALDARAYAAGNDIVFAQGAYAPGSASGRALIAHELAHTVQQGGVQMKAAGPMPAGADHALELEADRAAAAVLSGGIVPTLSQVHAPHLLRAPAAEAAPAPPAGTTALPPATDLPSGMVAVRDEANPKAVVVEIDKFVLPREKGKGAWVQQAYTDAGGGGATGRLVFSPLITGKTVAAYKEDDGAPYKEIWLGKFGFKTTAQLAEAFDALKAGPDDAKGAKAVKAAAQQPGVAELIAGMHKNLQDSGCDIDHIVEKQMGGTSIASNLQLLLSDKNQASGRDTYGALVTLVEKLREPGMRGAKAPKIQIRIKSAEVPAGASDASFIVETLLRSGDLSGSDAVRRKVLGRPVYVDAGGQGETFDVHDTNPSAIPAGAKRIVPGMRLTRYKRGPGAAASKSDEVLGRFDSKAMETHGDDAGDGKVVLAAVPLKQTAPPGTAQAGDPAAAEGAAGERRSLTIPSGPKKIKFYYPYLSPGTITVLGLDGEGYPTGEAVIHPSIGFLGDLKVSFGKDRFDLVKDIDVEGMNASAPMRRMAGFFRFTSGALKLDLLKFQPSGVVKFTIGPKAKPYVEGDITAKAEGTTFVATGTLKTAATLPGIKDGTGEISYRSDTGWSGSLNARSSTIKGATADVSMIFAEAKDGMKVAASGKVSTQVRGAQLELGAEWRDGSLAFYGGATIPKPLPMVESASLHGRYANGMLALSAKPKVKWKIGSTELLGEAVVNYYRKDDDHEGRFSGSVAFDIKNEKMDGKIALALSEDGKPTGKGELGYQVTKQFRPRLGVELQPDGKIKLSGSARFADITLKEAWPQPPNDRKTLLKLGATAHIPTPIPALSVTISVKGQLGVSYSVGPLKLTGLSLDASLYPFEEDRKITAKLAGAFVVPAHAALFGRFGVGIGAEAGYGALAAEGTLWLVPEIGVKGEGGLKIEAEYVDEGFSFAADAYAKGSMYGSLGVEFSVDVSALWGLVDHEWVLPIKKWGPKTIGPELDITLGRLAYARDGTITWPSLSQIDVKPKDFDPIEIMKDILRDSTGS